MRYVCCDLCGADDPVVVAETGRSGLPVRSVVCKRCGLVYTNPTRELSDYEGEAAARMRRLMRPAERPTEKYLVKSARRAVAAMDVLSDLLQPGVRLLDVGCAAGRLLLPARERGCEVEGVEPERAFAEFTREAVGCPVHECLLEDAPLEPGSFDVIAASHVLEHTASPSAFLGRVCELLRPGGHVFVEVPDILQPRCSVRRVFHVAHRFNFTPTVLAALLSKSGFSVVRRRELRGPGAVQAVAVRSANGGTRPHSEVEEYRKVLRALARHRYMYYLTGMFIRRKLTPTYE